MRLPDTSIDAILSKQAEIFTFDKMQHFKHFILCQISFSAKLEEIICKGTEIDPLFAILLTNIAILFIPRLFYIQNRRMLNLAQHKRTLHFHNPMYFGQLFEGKLIVGVQIF